jgi:hypothetical protein
MMRPIPSDFVPYNAAQSIHRRQPFGVFGFQAGFNYKLVDKREAVSDLCAALVLDGVVTKAPTGATSSFFASG